jgi:hypothetical protein
MHGGPGTGKTHVIKLLKDELFGQVLKWNIGVEFQVVAFQAVMADLLGGDTIHHALNISRFGKKGTNRRDGGAESQAIKTMNALLQLRWLIIDEISMVSARLLADVDLKLRSYVRAADPFAHNANSALRPFAGVDVLFSGDCWQLPPSDGGYLGEIPHELIENSRKYDPASPVISHGQSLLWSGAKTGVQDVTELTTCERTADEWLRSVQE